VFRLEKNRGVNNNRAAPRVSWWGGQGRRLKPRRAAEQIREPHEFEKGIF
jgi:hypothetical protein